MNYYLWFTCGGCNDGDHDYGLERFATEEGALSRVKQLEELRGSWDLQWTLIEGCVKAESK